MLLTVDIGNSEIQCGLFEKDAALPSIHWRLKTESLKTADEYYVIFQHYLTGKHLRGGVVSSVVPPINQTFKDLFERHLGIEFLSVTSTMPLPIVLNIDHPDELGADRIVNAVASRSIFPGPDLLIIDLGTATTFCLMKGSHYLGGAISPGFGISSHSLTRAAARLPRVDLSGELNTPIGKNTVDSMRIGILLGYAGLVNSLIDHSLKQLDANAKIIATGGWLNFVLPHIRHRVEVFPHLTLRGLHLLSTFSNPC